MSDELRPDIKAAKDRMRVGVGGAQLNLSVHLRRAISGLNRHLREGETVIAMAVGSYKHAGVLVLTDRRLLFLSEKIFDHTSEDFPLDKVTSIQWSAGMVKGDITVFAGGAKADITKVWKQDGKALVDAARGRLAQTKSASSPTEPYATQPSPPPSPPAAPPPPPPPAVPAGWYPSPTGSGQRYWDGSSWTEHTAP